MDIDDLVMISVDDHIIEPADMFEISVPAKYRDLAPRVVIDEHDNLQWWYGDIQGRVLGLRATAGKPREHFNVDASRYEDMRQGCYDVHERVRDMSAGGITAALNFPNWPGFAGQVLSQGPDHRINQVMISAYNDWQIDQWCGAYPDRFIPWGLVPLFDADAAAREVRRLADRGCHAISFSENPGALSMPTIHSGYWDPMFRAACDVGTIVCMHLGSSGKPVQATPDAPLSVLAVMSAARPIETLVEFMCSTLWHRFPDLLVSLSEGDIGWMPYFVQRCQHAYEVHSGWTGDSLPDGLSAADIFEKHFLLCFIEDAIGLEMLEHFNVDHIMWECDYPHSDTNWPYSPESIHRTFAGLPDDVTNKITHENAMRLFQFDPFRTRSREQCTVGALREEAADVDTDTHVGRRTDDRTAAVAMEFWAGHGSNRSSLITTSED